MSVTMDGAEAARRTTVGSGRLWLAAAMASSALVAAGAAHADEAGCTALNGKAYPASTMSLSSTGAKITGASWVAEKPNFQAYCKVLGQIDPVDPMATPILFEINLPADWNHKVLQEGGGGLNGVLVASTGILRDAPPGSQPLARGFATMGTDGGHPDAKPDIGVFFLNKEEVLNNSYGANKKAHDLSLAILKDYYAAAPSKFYFFGGSEGGRQAMVAVEKYPKDYDGVVAVVPALNSTSNNNLAKYNAWRAGFNGGWLDKAKLQVLQNASNDQCDALDGIKDGVISRYRGCLAIFKYEPIRCPGGKDTGDTCLSDKQIAAVKTWRAPYSWGFPLKNGITSIPGWSVGGEALAGSVNPWIMLDKAPEAEPLGRDVHASEFIRYYVMQDPNFSGDVPLKDPKIRKRLQDYSAFTDENDPDLSAFLKRGGKLIIKENTADYAVSPESTFGYYNSVVKKMGAKAVNGFIRIYVNPGVVHTGSGLRTDGTAIPDKVDLFGELDKWVESGKAPGVLTVTAYKAGQATASKPLCLFPDYPKYMGGGDANDAASFACVPLPAAPAKAAVKAVKTAKAEPAAKPAAKKG